jgi:hypothetical protein
VPSTMTSYSFAISSILTCGVCGYLYTLSEPKTCAESTFGVESRKMWCREDVTGDVVTGGVRCSDVWVRLHRSSAAPAGSFGLLLEPVSRLYH